MTIPRLRRRDVLTALAALSAGSVLPARAQQFPSRPIRYIIPFAAGGGSDAHGRIIAEVMGGLLGTQVVVENKGGASGAIALAELTASPPDGHTVLQLVNSTTAALAFQRKPLDADKRYAGVAGLYLAPTMLVVNPRVVDVQNLQEFIAFAKKNRGVDYTSAGPGSTGNLMMEVFGKENGISLTHVGYKGIALGLLDLSAGRLGAAMVGGSSIERYVTSGELRAIAIASSKRSTLVPNVRTAPEQGFANFISESICGVITAPGTPPAILARLEDAVMKAVAGERYQKFLRDNGNLPLAVNGRDFSDAIRKEYDRWDGLIKAGQVSPTQ